MFTKPLLMHGGGGVDKQECCEVFFNNEEVYTGEQVSKYTGDSERFEIMLLDDSLYEQGLSVHFVIDSSEYNRNFSYSKTGPTAGKYSVKIPVSMTPGVYQIVIQVINSNDQILFERAHIVNVKSTINFIGFVGGTDTGDIRSKYYGDTSRKLEVHCVSDKISQYEQTNITFNIHGTFYSRVMENGIAYLGINLSNGEYIVTVTSPLNGETITENITIIPSE